MNALLAFLSAHSDSIGIIVTTIAGLLWHRARGDAQDGARAQLKALAERIVHEELGDPRSETAAARVRIMVAQYAKPLLAKLKITGALADALIAEAVDIGLKELARALNSQLALDESVAQMSAASQRVLDAFKPRADNGGIPIPDGKAIVELVVVGQDDTVKP